jgi:hypothetical protein
VHVPQWLTIGVAVIVIIFGLYRMRIAFRTDEQDARARARKGLYAMGRRTHFLIGVVYLLLGGALVATSFGWNPLGGMFGPGSETPSKDKAPAADGSVPASQTFPAKTTTPATPATPTTK